MSVQSTLLWLKIASASVIGFGVLMALVPIPFIAAIVTLLADILILPIDGEQSLLAQETRLTLAIAGGIMVGWGVLFWMVTMKLFQREPRLVRQIFTTSISIWFVVDGAGSIAAGAWFNVIANSSFLFVFLIPLWLVDLSGDVKSEAKLDV